MNKLGFGFLRLAKADGAAPGQSGIDQYDLELTKKLFDAYLEAGHDYFDTSYTYEDGWSEKILGECLVKRHPRESFRLCDKLPGYRCKGDEDCQRLFDEQLERCGVDYFDVYMLHWINGDHYEIAQKYDQFAFLRGLKEKGLAKQIGFSYHDRADLLDQILSDHPEVDVVMLQINYLDWNSEGIQSRKCYETCVRHGKKIIVMEPVRGGTLADLPERAREVLQRVHTDWSDTSWAIRFASSLPGVDLVLSGMTSMDQLQENLEDFEPLNKEEEDALDFAAEIIGAQKQIACTGCHYCMEYCPQGLRISEIFEIYNDLQAYPEEEWKLRPIYEKLPNNASDCLDCGACMGHCPQRVDIPESMKIVADMIK